MNIDSLLEKVDRGYLCLSCGYFEKRVSRGYIDKCPVCGGPLVPVINEIPEPSSEKGVWRWSSAFLHTDLSKKITLFEGSTPLIRLDRLGREYKIKNLFFKDESRNPTSLFIDRGSAYLSSVLASRGVRSILVFSRGDLSISMGSYARRARIKIFSFVPSDIIPSKLYRVKLISSRTTLVDDFDTLLNLMNRFSMKFKNKYVVSQTNPYLMSGFQTILFEIIHDLGTPPKAILLPFGDGALMASLLILVKKLRLRTKLIGVTTNFSSPALYEIREDRSLLKEYVDELIKDTEHEIIRVSEDSVLSAIRYLAREEGVPADPVNASLVSSIHSDYIKVMGLENVVLLFTGGVLTDPVVIRAVLEERENRMISLGFTKEKILEILLEEEDASAYRIWQRLRSTYNIKISLRSIYNHLNDLEKRKLIRSEIVRDESSGRPKKIYVLNDLAYVFLKK